MPNRDAESAEQSFFSRARLVKHLLERRIRSKNRTKTCAQEWLERFPEPIPDAEYERLEAEVAEQAAKARKAGRRWVPADRPAEPVQKKARL